MNADPTICPKCEKPKATPEERRIIPEGEGDWLCWEEGNACWLDDYPVAEMAVRADREHTLDSLRREAEEIGGCAPGGRAEWLRRVAKELERRWE